MLSSVFAPRAIRMQSFCVLITVTAVLIGSAQAASTRNWKAVPADNALNNAANWDTLPVAGDTLNFAASTITTLNNNFAAATSFGGVTFAAGSSAFTING